MSGAVKYIQSPTHWRAASAEEKVRAGFMLIPEIGASMVM
jgi:hypothetical protein